MRQVDAGTVKLFPRREMLDLVVVDGKARGIVVPQPDRPAQIERHAAHAVVPRHRRLRHRVLPVDQRGELERHGRLARAQARRALRQPVLHADPPDVHPGQRRPPVEAHADERDRSGTTAASGCRRRRRQAAAASRFPKPSATTTSNGKYPSFGNLVPRDVASRNAKAVCDEGRGVGETGLSVYLDFADAITRLGVDTIRARYGNLFDMYKRITDEDPYKVPMRIYPAIHYTMGGLWVDYNLMSNASGPARARRGELLRSRREPSRRQRADAGPGRRLLRHPVHDRRLPREHVAARRSRRITTRSRRPRRPTQERLDRLLVGQGHANGPRLPSRGWRRPVGRRRACRGPTRACARRSTEDSHAARGVLAGRLGARREDEPEPGARLRAAASPTTSSSASCWRSTRCTAPNRAAGTSARRARRPKAKRCATTTTSRTSAAWEFSGVGQPPALHQEPLVWENVHPTQRSYK